MGRRVLITAGPTRECIDPVRFVSNRSSGKMGFAVANAAREAGAEVILVSGPVALPTPPGVRRVEVESAADMLAAVLREVDGADIFISTAAVADYRPTHTYDQKIKKTSDRMDLTMNARPTSSARWRLERRGRLLWVLRPKLRPSNRMPAASFEEKSRHDCGQRGGHRQSLRLRGQPSHRAMAHRQERARAGAQVRSGGTTGGSDCGSPGGASQQR